jgi:hypothetical protein
LILLGGPRRQPCYLLAWAASVVTAAIVTAAVAVVLPFAAACAATGAAAATIFSATISSWECVPNTLPNVVSTFWNQSY